MTGPGTDDVVALTQDLIRIDSSNPDLTSGGAGESAIADHVISWLDTRGFLVRRLEETAGRPSVLAVAPGTGGGRSLMLNGHLDTVSLTSYKNDPLDPVVVDGNLYGRGSYDMLSGIAAMMVAAHRAHRSPHAGDIVLALVADEEAGSLGTAEVLRHIRTDAAIVCEPSGLDLTIAHRGFVWAEVTIHGRAAHGSRPDLGIDAITRAGGFLTGLHQLADELSRRPPHPLLGHGNVHAGVITGGQETSSYPEQCTITIEWRTLPGENAATVRDELNQLLRAALDGDIDYDLTITVHREPFAAGDATSDIVTVSSQVLARHLDREPLRRGEPFWTDCALLAEAGIDTVLFGVDGGGAHAATEWVTIDSLLTLVATLTEVIGEYTGPTRPAEPPARWGRRPFTVTPQIPHSSDEPITVRFLDHEQLRHASQAGLAPVVPRRHRRSHIGDRFSLVDRLKEWSAAACVPQKGPLAAVGEHRAGLGGKSIRTVRVWRQSGDGAAYCQ